MVSPGKRTLRQRESFRALVVGDTQRIMPIERLARGHDTNDEGRAAVAQQMHAEECDVRVHLGDLVGVVGSKRHWARFDSHYPPEIFGGENWLVCRGNHDCGGVFLGKDREFVQRHPETIGKLRVFDFEFVTLILLDTNAAVCHSSYWEQQRVDFVSALERADEDPAVRHVLVFGHHPPLTNGRWIRGRANGIVHATFFEPFLACHKSRAFFAGHVHGYERFRVKGRQFIVTGGGGGPRVAHLHGARRRYPSEVDIADPHPLHYVRVTATPDQVNIRTQYRHETTGAWGILDACDVQAA